MENTKEEKFTKTSTQHPSEPRVKDKNRQIKEQSEKENNKKNDNNK